MITAAHCCDGNTPEGVTVVAGEHRLYDNTDGGTEQLVPVQEITMHPEYSRFTITNDVCLLTLAAPIDINE